MLQSEISFLKSVYLFNQLNEDELNKILNICKKVHYKKGEIIIHEDNPGSSMYILKDGKVEVCHSLTLKISKKGFEETEKSMLILDSDDSPFFGDMAILSEAPRSATVKTLSSCTLYKITKNDFNTFCQQYPDVGYKILMPMCKVLCDRVRKGNEDILKLTTILSIVLTN